MLCYVCNIEISCHRTNIESSYGHQVAQLRKEYSQEDMKLIKEALEAKLSSSQKSDSPTHVQKKTTKEEAIYGTTYIIL